MTTRVTKNARPSFHFSGGFRNETSVAKGENSVGTGIKFLTIMYRTAPQVPYFSQWLSVSMFVLCPGEICATCVAITVSNFRSSL